MDIKDKILTNEENETVLSFLKINTPNNSVFVIKKSEQTNYFYDQGIKDLWNLYGNQIPEEFKFTINGTGILVNPRTGEIFTFVFDQYYFLIKYDFEKNKVPNSDELRILRSLSGIEEDFRKLGEKWVLVFGDKKDQIMNSFKKYGS